MLIRNSKAKSTCHYENAGLVSERHQVEDRWKKAMGQQKVVESMAGAVLVALAVIEGQK